MLGDWTSCAGVTVWGFPRNDFQQSWYELSENSGFVNSEPNNFSRENEDQTRGFPCSFPTNPYIFRRTSVGKTNGSGSWTSGTPTCSGGFGNDISEHRFFVRIIIGFDTISDTKKTEKQHVTQVIVLCSSNSSELDNGSTLLTRLAFACVNKMCWHYGFIHFNYMWYENLIQKMKLFFPFKWISCRQHLWTFYRLARICASAPERWYQKTPLLKVSLLGGLNMFQNVSNILKYCIVLYFILHYLHSMMIIDNHWRSFFSRRLKL